MSISATVCSAIVSCVASHACEPHSPAPLTLMATLLHSVVCPFYGPCALHPLGILIAFSQLQKYLIALSYRGKGWIFTV